MKSNKGLFYSSLFISLFLLLPFYFLFFKGIEGHANEWEHISKNLLSQYVLNTFYILLSVGALCLIWGVFPAYLLSRFRFFGSNFFKWALVGPLAIPTFIMAIVYSGLTDISGPLASLSRFLFDSPHLLRIDILNFWGLSLTLSFALYPYVYLSSLIAFTNRTRSFEEAAKSLGAKNNSIFFRITLPLALPFVLSGLLLVLMETLNNYGAMKYYGYNTLTVGLFKAWFDLNDLTSAVYIGGILFVFALIMLLIRQGTHFKGEKENSSSTNRQKLSGIKNALATLFCTLLFGFAFIAPCLFIITKGIKKFGQVVDGEFFLTVVNTIVICSCSAILIVFISLYFSSSKRWLKSTLLRNLFEMNNTGYAIPGAIIAIGIVAFAQLATIHSGLLFWSFILMCFGFVIRFLSSGFQTIDNALKNKSIAQDESAMSLGARSWGVFKNIHLPQLKLPIIIAFSIVFIEIIKELPLTLILKPFNFESLSTLTFQYAKDEMLEMACVPAMFILIITIVPNFLIQKALND
ncbi:MAG: iron ABC transporter permease [Bacteroidota bacterium]